MKDKSGFTRTIVRPALPLGVPSPRTGQAINARGSWHVDGPSFGAFGRGQPEIIELRYVAGLSYTEILPSLSSDWHSITFSILRLG